jgi:peptidoglycan/xylan/chitin deacetylase (PgdA/CDA1 family)
MTHGAKSGWSGGHFLFAALWLVGTVAIVSMALKAIPGGPVGITGVCLALATTVAVGVMSQRCGFFARPLNEVVDGAGCALALTFDDGPDPEHTPRVLELLAGAGARATFFVIGDKVARHPTLARRIAEEGHELANHTTSHHWHMALWPARAVAADLDVTSQLIASTTGQRPAFFRPPAAVLSPRIAVGARDARLALVGYTVRSGDGSAVVPARHVLRRLQRGLRPGAILMMHDGAVDGAAPASLEVLPALLSELRARGLRSVTLSELVGQAAGSGLQASGTTGSP